MSSKKKKINIETKHIRYSLLLSLGFSCLLIGLHLIPLNSCLGVEPRSLSGATGILTATFFHADWQHLWSNLGPLFFLMTGAFYYFPDRFMLVVGVGILLVNTTVWIAARSACHIGSSGLAYLLAAYLVTMAFYNRQKKLSAFILIIVFLYGGMIWGILPKEGKISWESHLFGALWGVALAMILKADKTWDQLLAKNTQADNQSYFDIPIKIDSAMNENSAHSSSFNTTLDNNYEFNYGEITYTYEEKSTTKPKTK